MPAVSEAETKGLYSLRGLRLGGESLQPGTHLPMLEGRPRRVLRRLMESFRIGWLTKAEAEKLRDNQAEKVERDKAKTQRRSLRRKKERRAAIDRDLDQLERQRIALDDRGEALSAEIEALEAEIPPGPASERLPDPEPGAVLSDLTVPELKVLAHERGIELAKGLKKAEIIAALEG